jgi:ribosomal protein S18
MFDTKVSPSGTSDALFQECLDAIRRKRAEQEVDSHRELQQDSQAITQLREEELELTRKVFRRVDPGRDLTSDHEHLDNHIDPYWSPFHKVRDLREQVTAEFDEYARYVSVAEQKRVRIQIKKSLRRVALSYNPYSPAFTNYHDRKKNVEEPPKPFRLPDKHWDRTPLQERLGKEKITWRDLDIIQHFVADNGFILPRRTTMLSRRKQAELVMAVKNAQRMSLLPYNWKLPDYQAMPLMDPFQWMVDRLTDRVLEARDLRSRAMLKVMMGRHPELNYGRFLRHEASRAPDEREADGRGAPDQRPPSDARGAATAQTPADNV